MTTVQERRLTDRNGAADGGGHGRFECPFDGCDDGPFATVNGWTSHLEDEHGVEGPL